MYLQANICFTEFVMCCEKVKESLTSCNVLPSINKFQKFRNCILSNYYLGQEDFQNSQKHVQLISS
jgi:hypothetical protein